MYSDSRTAQSQPSPSKRLLALLLVVSLSRLGGPPVSLDGEPTPGRREHQRFGEVSLRYGSVNATGVWQFKHSQPTAGSLWYSAWN